MRIDPRFRGWSHHPGIDAGSRLPEGDGVTVTASLHRDPGLTDHEYEQIRERLGRDPSYTELAMFSVMWSEHCSYKSSRVHLKTLPTEGPHILVGPGEGAGIN